MSPRLLRWWFPLFAALLVADLAVIFKYTPHYALHSPLMLVCALMMVVSLLLVFTASQMKGRPP